MVAALLVSFLESGVSAAEFRFHNAYSDDMVLQRDRAVAVSGFAEPGAQISAEFKGQTQTAVADENGAWTLRLDAMAADAKGRPLKVRSGGDAVALKNVVVGDVWFFGRQTFIDISLARDEEGLRAAKGFKAKGTFRALVIDTEAANAQQDELNTVAAWVEVDRKNALSMSAAAFYLGRDLANDSDVPVGIIDVNMGPYFGIGWLSEKALADAAIKYPNDKEIDWLPKHMRERADRRDSGQAQSELDAYWEERVARSGGRSPGTKPSLGLHPMQNPVYPSGGYNAVVHPLKGLTLKGVLLQLGNDYPFIAYRSLDLNGTATEKAELDAAWQENYLILKNGYRVTSVTLPYVPGEWRKAFGDSTLPIGLILPPSSDLDVYAAHNREIRELHRRTAEQAEGIGLIMPGNENVPSSGQPADEALLAERCMQWVMGVAAGEAASGPMLDRVEAKLSKATLHFKPGTADGLMATGDALAQFETAGPDREFSAAQAQIEGSTIKLKSEGPIAFVRYNWSYAPDQGLVNSAGLPAVPFSTDADWTFGWIPPPETPELPEEYHKTADTWGASDVAIINGQIANMAQGDSEPIPRRPGPLGLVASPFGPNIYVVGTEPGGPADGLLMEGDVIYGVNGKVFAAGEGASADTTYRALSEAITYSESEEGQGNLVLSLRRGMEAMDVTVQLKVLGSYSSTTPYYCEKSENIVADAEAWISKQYRPEQGAASEPTGMLDTDLLFLLASATPEQQGLVRRAIYSVMARMDPLKPVEPYEQSKPWHTGYQSMLLGEYYHATGDRNVLPYLKRLALLSSESQLKPQSETAAHKEAAQSEEQVGGWRQNYPASPERWKSGYGLMPHAGITCVMGMVLADEAGLEIDDVAMARGLKHFNDGRAEYGFVVYGYANTHRDGPPKINPEAEAKGKLWSMNGKLGTAAALYRLVGYNDTVDICSRHCVYGYNNTRGGHGGMFFNNFWTPIGAWASGEHAYKHFMKGQTWWRELFRRHDGSFNQVGRGRIGVSYGLPYVAPKERLRMLGAPKSAFGTHAPDYLQPALDAHAARDYALAETLILEQLNDHVRPAEDMPVVNHMLESVRILRASIEHDLALVESLIEADKHYYASLELRQLKGVVSADDARLQAIIATLEAPVGRAEITRHRKACEAESSRLAAAAKAAAPKLQRAWSPALGDTRWQMKVVEHIDQAPENWTSPAFDDATWNAATLPISWTMYHTALFRKRFTVEDPAALDSLRVRGNFFQQANVVIHLNGELVAKIDEIGRGSGNTLAPLTDYARTLLKPGENTIAISSRHKRRWGPYRGTYKTAQTVSFTLEATLALSE